VVVVAAGVAASWLGTRDPAGAIDGQLLGSTTAPAGIAVLVALIVAGFRRRHRAAALLAHAGVVVFALGVVGSLASTSHRGTIDLGTTERLGGYDVTIVGARVVTERADLVALRIDALIDGRPVVASILDHPDLNRTRARPGRLVDPGGETELVVSLLADDRARVELRRHPGLPFVWIGGALVVAGLVVSACGSRGQPSRRRRRLASSSESSGEAAPASPSGR
jgi:cytochrome c-type biogenesis protein NrfE